MAFNDALNYAQSNYAAGNHYPGANAIQKVVLTEGKKRSDRAWMNDLCGVALIQAVRDMHTGYQNFFASVTGHRKGKLVRPPKFKSRHDSRQSARFTRAAHFMVTQTGERKATVRLTGIGELAFVLSRALPSDPSSVTVIREADGRVYVSFVVKVTDQPAATAGRMCGIDPGLSTFAAVLTVDTNTGEELDSKIETPMFLRRKARALARSQRSLSRKQKGSKNRQKARQRVAVVHRKVRESRLDHAHKTAAKIVATHDVIAIEDLAVSGMARTNLAKSVHDQAMGQFLQILVSLAARRGRTLVKVGRFYPSTQICSGCNKVTGPKGQSQLHVRTWTCVECGVTHDRDVNAARNILFEGLRLLNEHQSVAGGQPETLNASRSGGRSHLAGGGDGVSPAALPLAPVDEAGRTTGDRDKELVFA